MSITFGKDIAIENHNDISERIHALLLDYGVRSDNTYVGSGMGGNLANLLALLNYSFHISSDLNVSNIDDDRRLITLNLSCFKSFQSLRLIVDKLLGNIPQEDRSYFEKISENINNIDELELLIFENSNEYLKELLKASKISRNIADKLDNNNTDVVDDFKQLNHIMCYIRFPVIRSNIGIERVIRHSLDINDDINRSLENINDSLSLYR